jgi:hypothetical protein
MLLLLLLVVVVRLRVESRGRLGPEQQGLVQLLM